jgi:predicted permease
MPDWKTLVRQRLAPLNLTAAAEAEFVEELAQHLEDRFRELQSGGATDDEAYAGAMSELEDIYALRADLMGNRQMPKHDAVPSGKLASGNFFEDAWQDVRYALRTMRKSPIFVLFAVGTLATGIGANTTIFTVINTLFLNPLPAPRSSELVALVGAGSRTGSNSTATLPMAFPDLKEYMARNQVFRSLAGYTSPRVLTYDSGGGSERMFAELVTGNYFSTLELQPALGRFFLRDEDGAPGAHAVAIMNYATWQTRFGGAAGIVGRTVRLNNLVFTIVGVAPRQFIGVSGIFGPDLWIPAAMAEVLLPGEMDGVLSNRSKTAFQGVARLKAGVSRAQAEANAATIADALAREYPQTNERRTASVRPVKDVMLGSDNSQNGRAPLLFGSVVLLAVAGIILLIACSNVANLFIARSAARQREIAVRLAIGASRGRLIRQLITESLLLGVLSGTAGLVIGYEGLQLLWSFRPSEVSANLIQPKLDGAVFGFSVALSLLTGILFGTIPAMRASRARVAEELKEQTRTAGRSRRRITFANALLVGQVTFSFVSLMTAALFLRSIQRAYEINPGFQTAHLAVFMTNPGQAGYLKPQTESFYKAVRERVAALPGVESASWASNLPLWGRVATGLQVEGREPRSKDDAITTVVNTIGIDYFKTTGIAIEHGRDFTAMDRGSSKPVAIVNQKLARDYWPGQEAIGKYVRLPAESIRREIVGVARNANYSTLGEPPQPCVYVPQEQSFSDAMVLYVRPSGDPQRILVPVQREVRAVAPRVSVDDVRTGSKILDQALFSARAGVILLSIFGFLALGLASVGLYGIMAYAVERRRAEIGVRMALGADRGSVIALVLRQGMALVLAGVLLGIVAAVLSGRVLAGMLYGIGANDPLSIAGAACVLVIVAVAACCLPARSASRVDPLVTLREA